MINISNEVFTKITNALKAFESSVETSSVCTNTPSKYPFVSIEEIENSLYDNGIDSCEMENFANISYEINVYCKGEEKRAKARALLEVADNTLKDIGFARISVIPMQDQNETIYRYVARYSAVVGKDHTIYRR